MNFNEMNTKNDKSMTNGRYYQELKRDLSVGDSNYLFVAFPSLF